MRRVVLALALLGALLAGGAVILSDLVAGAAPTRVPVPSAPFAAWVAGAGTLEASTQNVAVGVPVSGIVSRVEVSWGDAVKPGDTLFTLDDRDLQARLGSAHARVRVSEAALAKAEHALGFLADLHEVVSTRDLTAARDAVAAARADLALARAQVGEIQTEIERRVVRAPVAGRVLHLDVRPGELAPETALPTPLLLLGDDRELLVRVDVDQHDSWRVLPGAKAVAFVRGNPSLRIPLRFVRIEPFVLPKTTFTGRTTERTDEKVLCVIYAFDRGELPVYVGQDVDVFIEALPLEAD